MMRNMTKHLVAPWLWHTIPAQPCCQGMMQLALAHTLTCPHPCMPHTYSVAIVHQFSHHKASQGLQSNLPMSTCKRVALGMLLSSITGIKTQAVASCDFKVKHACMIPQGDCA